MPAGELEKFVVERIRHIGKDPALIRDMLEAVTQKRAVELHALRSEQNRIRGELQHLRNEERNLVSAAAQDNVAAQVLTDRLADVQERMQRLERRETEIREQIIAIERSTVNEEDIRCALSMFDPVWDHLFPREQARILSLLIDKVEYHGGEGTLEITFRDAGIKTLAEEASPNE